jgi:antitoxin component YwqK of YwqJK toxin-antitoxin module
MRSLIKFFPLLAMAAILVSCAAEPVKEYWPNGNLKSEIRYDKDGKQDGVAKFFYENGAVKEESNWEHDLQQGTSRLLYENGAAMEETNWKAGKLDGPATFFYENGKTKATRTYKDGMDEGLFKEFRSDGTVSQEINFKNGKQDGLYKSYDEFGIIIEESEWKDGKRHGITKYFNKEGKVISEATYENDVKAGEANHHAGTPETPPQEDGQKSPDVKNPVDAKKPSDPLPVKGKAPAGIMKGEPNPQSPKGK